MLDEQPDGRPPSGEVIFTTRFANKDSTISDMSDPHAIRDGAIHPRDAADYIAVMLEDLHHMAEIGGHAFLAYLIQVAIHEAKHQAEQ